MRWGEMCGLWMRWAGGFLVGCGVAMAVSLEGRRDTQQGELSCGLDDGDAKAARGRRMLDRNSGALLGAYINQGIIWSCSLPRPPISWEKSPWEQEVNEWARCSVSMAMAIGDRRFTDWDCHMGKRGGEGEGSLYVDVR